MKKIIAMVMVVAGLLFTQGMTASAHTSYRYGCYYRPVVYRSYCAPVRSYCYPPSYYYSDCDYGYAPTYYGYGC